jgi:hypothetical protein
MMYGLTNATSTHEAEWRPIIPPENKSTVNPVKNPRTNNQIRSISKGSIIIKRRYTNGLM